MDINTFTDKLCKASLYGYSTQVYKTGKTRLSYYSDDTVWITIDNVYVWSVSLNDPKFDDSLKKAYAKYIV